jgi:hypothetical protein
MSKKTSLIVVVVLAATALVFYYRFHLVFYYQQWQIRSIATASNINNKQFSSADSVHQQHLIYQLKGNERLLPHRVNSLKRLQFLYPHFKGFETDIRFNHQTGFLHIGHDEADIAALTLNDFLLVDTAKKFFWLDIKNVDSNHAAALLQALQLLDQTFHIKQRVLVESSSLNVVQLLAADGFLTSYYLPVDSNSPIPQLAKNAAAYKGMVSQEYALLPQLIQHFPQQPKASWEISFTQCHSAKQLADLANNATILCCLINVKSPGYR